jgi:NADPH:quinone reductase-like Zn-dependent oxidoreductase
MTQQMMRAVRFHDYGPAAVLVVEDVPRPEPKDGEVLVHVHAAGVNPVDWKIRRGDMRNFRSVPLPAIPGIDLAGIVAAVGPGVTAFQSGQAVFGSGSGAYAEYAVVPADNLAVLPHNLSFDQAATVPVGSRTAWTAIFDGAGLAAGQRLLVQGAAGGVGLFAVQLGRWKGAHVIGTASTANVDFVRSLGAETVVDYTKTPVERVVQGADVVLDTVGGPGTEHLLPTLKAGGIIVSIAGPVSEEAARQRGVHVGRAVPPSSLSALLRQVAGLIEAGTVVPVLGEVFPLEEVQRAHLLSETGHGRGRIVLHIAE